MRQLLESLRPLCVFCTLTVFAGGVLYAENVHLAWASNPESDLAGYKLHVGTKRGQYAAAIDAGNVTNYTLTGLTRGTYYITLSAYNSHGLESSYSNEITAALDVPDGSSTPVVRTTGNVATITWTSSRPSTVVVEYGLSLRYGLTTPISYTSSTTHTVVLTGLAPATTYQYRTKSVDAEGNISIGGNRSFTTAASADGALTTTLTYPRAITVTDVEQYTGIAIVNTGGRAALLNFRALDASGTFGGGSGDTNASVRILYPGEQIAILENEIFGSAFPDSKAPAWIEIQSSVPEVVGFFIVFDTSLTSINGTILSKQTSKSLIFPETVPEAVVRVMLRNPNDTSAVVSFDLVSTQGWNLSSVSRTIGPRSSLAATVMDLFPGISAERYSYLRIASNQPLYGYELVESSSQWISLLERPATGSGTKKLYAAQYVYGGPWASELSVINADPIHDTVAQQWIADDGTQIGRTCTAPLPGSGRIQFTDPSCFGVVPHDIRQGYVEINAGQSGIMGNIVLRDLEGRRSATSLPLLSELRTSYVIPHVASDSTYFTGIAILNPGDSGATVTTRVLDSNGAVVASLSEALPSRQRKSRVLTQMFPSLIGRSLLSGYIRITSDKPLAVFSLFGTNDLVTLLALPAQPGP